MIYPEELIGRKINFWLAILIIAIVATVAGFFILT